MKRVLNKTTKISALLLVCVYPIASLSATSTSQIKQLQHRVQRQQKQLAQQQKQLGSMSVKLDKLAKEKPLPAPVTTAGKKPKKRHLDIPVYKKAHLLISGAVNELVMYADDGYSPQFFYGSNDYHISRLTLVPYVQVSPDFSVGGKLEAGFEFNPSNDISQINPTVNGGIEMRKLEVFFKSKTWGSLLLGRGKTASDDSARQDLSGTRDVADSDVQKIGGGLIFRSSGTDNFTGPQVGDVIDNLDGLSRRNRIRYDSPSWYGFHVATSAIEGKANDVALWYRDKLHGTDIAGAVAYTSATDITDDAGNIVAYGNLIDGSLSILFPCGLSVTSAAGYVSDNEVGRPNDPNFYYFKLGLMRQYFSPGKTAISVDFGRYDDFDINNDRSKSYGVALAQYIDAWNLTIYTMYRNFQLTRAITHFHSINVAALGARFNF